MLEHGSGLLFLSLPFALQASLLRSRNPLKTVTQNQRAQTLLSSSAKALCPKSYHSWTGLETPHHFCYLFQVRIWLIEKLTSFLQLYLMDGNFSHYLIFFLIFCFHLEYFYTLLWKDARRSHLPQQNEVCSQHYCVHGPESHSLPEGLAKRSSLLPDQRACFLMKQPLRSLANVYSKYF